MKILNGTVADSPLAHVYELSDYMVISGSMYNKNPLYPLPLKFGLLEDENSSVYFKETYDVTENAVIRYRNNKNTYIADKTDYKIHYTFYDNLGMYKMVEKDDGLEITRFDFTPTETYFSIEYSMQTDKYIVFIVRYSATSDLYILNKNDLSVLNTKSYPYFLSTLGFYYDKYEDKYYVHLLSRTSLTNGSLYCYSIELESLTQTTVKDYSATSTSYYFNYVFDVVRQTDNKSYFVAKGNGSTTDAYLYTYNITGASTATVILNRFYSIVNKTVAGEKMFVFNPEPNYIAIVEVDSTNNVNTTSNYSNIQINKYAFTSGDLNFKESWTATNNYSSYVNIKPSLEHQTYNYNICGRIKDDQTIFFANQEKLAIYKWDTEQKIYVLHNEFFENIEKICIDANNNMWIRNADKDLYTVDVDYSDYTIILSTDETDFDYINEDINTTIKVRAIDRNDNDVRCHVILKIDGVAKFTENNKQTIELDLIGEEMEIPITIFDQGIINIVYLN